MTKTIDPFYHHSSKEFHCSNVGQNNQEYRLKYWAFHSSVRSFARTTHLFTRLLTSLTPSLVGK